MSAPVASVGPNPVEMPVVSFVLATFNERENLPELLNRLRKISLPAFELLVVDDGSTDGTRELLEGEARSDARLRLLWHQGKQTTLRAQCQGIALARGQYLVVMDADLQHPPEVVPAMVSALKDGASLVIGSRYAKGGSAGARGGIRATISRGAEITAKVFLSESRSVSDPVSGFFAFRREVFRPLPPDWRGYKLLLFLLVMARGKRVTEVGFRFEPRAGGSSKVTQNSRFVRFFLTELILARRLERSIALEARRSSASPSSAR
jgi:dolichol-phosphate mannosyltransferase